MICQFCKQDIERPCSNEREVHERAQNHEPQCERALKAQISDRINPSDGQSAGSV